LTWITSLWTQPGDISERKRKGTLLREKWRGETGIFWDLSSTKRDPLLHRPASDRRAKKGGKSSAVGTAGKKKKCEVIGNHTTRTVSALKGPWISG